MGWTNATKTLRATLDALKCGEIVLEAIMLTWLFGHATLMAVYKSKKGLTVSEDVRHYAEAGITELQGALGLVWLPLLK